VAMLQINEAGNGSLGKVRNMRLLRTLRRGTLFGLLLIFALAAPAIGVRAASVEDFYRGKSVDMIIASEVGGGYDVYARLVATFLEKHMPGHPHFVPKQMVGAGGMIATNYLANVAAKDGSVIAQVQNTIPFQPLLAPKGVRFDAVKLGYIGSANSETSVAFVWHTSSVKNFAQLQQHETLMAGVNRSISAQYAQAMNELAGAKIKIITGYAGATQSMLAVERGEVDGYPAIFWSTLKATKPDWLKQNSIRILVQMALKKNPELPDVPLIFDYIKNDTDRRVAELLLAPLLGGRPFIAPPGIPAERLAALRAAFTATMHDPDFLAEAAKHALEIQYVSGEELAAIVTKAAQSPPEIVDHVRAIYEGR
jgi:tripartite-type tricarboxylate transporter receptor subunit TctC